VNKDTWFAFLWTIALSDHLGDVMEAVEAFGEIEGLELPPKELDLAQWISWLENNGWSSDAPSLWEMKCRLTEGG